jgi:hypothetical protein
MSIERPTVREALLAREGGGDAHRREAIEDNFFRRLGLPGGVTKCTRRGRLADLDALVAEHLPCGRRLELMDVAVSSGVTTLDWAASLRRAGFDFGLVAGDATPAAWLLSLGRRVEVLVDGAGRPLQYDLYGLAIRSAATGPLAMLPWLGRLLTRFALAWDGDLRRSLAAGREVRGRRPLRSQRVALVVPELLADPAIELVEDDLLAWAADPLAGRFDVVRAANLLNRGYFDEDALRRMLARLVARLKPGSLLAVCRTEEGGSNHATVFRRGEEGLEPIARLGCGSEVEELAASLSPIPERS